jgi:hypothetical protein
VREIRKLRSTWRGLETWHGRDAVTLADERARQQGTRTSTYTGAPVSDPTDERGWKTERWPCGPKLPRPSSTLLQSDPPPEIVRVASSLGQLSCGFKSRALCAAHSACKSAKAAPRLAACVLSSVSYRNWIVPRMAVASLIGRLLVHGVF